MGWIESRFQALGVICLVVAALLSVALGCIPLAVVSSVGALAICAYALVAHGGGAGRQLLQNGATATVNLPQAQQETGARLKEKTNYWGSSKPPAHFGQEVLALRADTQLAAEMGCLRSPNTNSLLSVFTAAKPFLPRFFYSPILMRAA